jgi:hypothetical protein
MTVMTLVTVNCTDILKGAHPYFVGSLTPSTYPDEPDDKSKEPLTYAIFEVTSGVGFVEPPS